MNFRSSVRRFLRGVPRIMGVTMMCRVRALSALALALTASAAAIPGPAAAGGLPEVKLSAKNAIPACATPGRLQSFLESRNGKIDPKFGAIAADYARTGEDLKVRWDVAFFQMLLETGNLSFTGDVSPKQNNFAGLGATGRHEPGETFADVKTGVKAHLQHLLMYAGETVADPVAERTRKVQEWGVLDNWLKSSDEPMTFDRLAKKWAPGSRGYARDIGGISDAFYSGLCKQADPKPELTASLVGASKETKTAAVDTPKPSGDGPAKVSGAELARKANEDARASGEYTRSGLGGGSLFGLGETAKAAAAALPKSQPDVKILNATPDDASDTNDATAAPASAAQAAPEPPAKIQTAALSGLKSAVPAAAPPAKTSCKVWTASYGGAHAVIIKAKADGTDNYTVLDVNENAEKREAEAYISAYAKGGQTVGEFASSAQALDKAFELCPEG